MRFFVISHTNFRTSKASHHPPLNLLTTFRQQLSTDVSQLNLIFLLLILQSNLNISTKYEYIIIFLFVKKKFK